MNQPNPTQSNLVTPFRPDAPPFFFKTPELQSRYWRACYAAALREFPAATFGRIESKKMAQIFADTEEAARMGATPVAPPPNE